ncbi:S9 family peptidase [Acidomonas methanolica]|uniref:S9 family peptidase n=1 Tax=Acidomonas methanolica TaxID=437 RepID=UPI00211A0B11|nr:S9 family peptidase [Acidomonas methanolica]MCQ9156014.1 S9 family peptidase [Acidomonas methanolica]
MSAVQPPSPRREPKTVTQLGRSRVDEYGWMKDENWQQVLRDPSVLREDVAAHLRAENAYADAVLKEIEPLRETLLREMIARIPPAEESVPVPDGPWAYYARYFEGAQHPVHARKPRTGGAEELLLDVDAEAKAHPYYALGGAAHTEDHRYYVYAEDVQGSEVYRIQVKDLASGRLCAPPVESTTGSFVVSPDSRWLFWIYRDDHGRPSRIYRRPLLGGEDVLVFDEPDAGFFLQLALSTSRRWIVIERGDHDTNETLLIPARAPDTPPRVAAPLVRGEKYSLAHWNDRFIVLTNTGGAVDFQLMWTPEDATGREHWQPFVPHMAGRYLLELSAGRDFLVWAERMDGNIVLRFVSRGVEGDVRAASAVIAMDEPAYDLTMLGVLEYDAPVLRYVYESPTTPAHWYDYDMASGERVLRKVREVPSGHDPQAYEVRRLFAPAADGETVPVTVLMRRGTVLDGAAPLLLYGYGSYGIPMDAGFSTSVFSLVDRGWVYAIAHIRGGSEKGWKWFLDGRGTKKVNSFTDFIASAGYLAETGYGAAGRIVAHGGSAGGLLMGAVANMAPDLFAGIVAQVPFVDMLNTMSDVTLPLTPPEWPEWGNPLEDEAAYDLIASYSPYDNVAARPYPPILAMGGLSDPRVTYWEPAKWIARLRAVASGGPFLCRINMEAGHGGSPGRFKRLEEVALVQAFAVWATARRRN